MNYKDKIKQAKKEIHTKAKDIKQEEKAKYHEKTKELDKNYDQKANAAKKEVISNQAYLFGGKSFKELVTQGDSWYRGFLWLIQVWLFWLIVFYTTIFIAYSFLPSLGNNFGHALGLSVHADIIDKVNLMFIPTMFTGLGILVAEYIIFRWFWKVLNRLFGHLRYKSKLKHNRLSITTD